MRESMTNPDNYRLIEVSVSRMRQVAVPRGWSDDFARAVAAQILLDEIVADPSLDSEIFTREIPMRPFDDDMDTSQVIER